jgi:hypothetical protein
MGVARRPAAVIGSWTMPARAASGVAAFLLCLAAGLAGCDNEGTTGPRTSGLTIVTQELVADGGGCRLRVTLQNRTGTDVSGILVFNLVGATGTTIGSGAVFPLVPDGETRLATSDVLVATPGGRQLACSEIPTVRVDRTRSNVPVA